MKNMIYLYGVILLVYNFANTQVQLEWVSCYNGPADDWDTALAITGDDSGNVYVTGSSPGIGTGRDYATIKYNANGDMVWVRRFNGPENGFDVARDIALDDSGNVYVSGTSVYGTIKYDRDGNEIWMRRYGLYSAGYRIALDDAGNIYLTGESTENFATLKYDFSGNLLWAREYNGPANYRDRAEDLALDSWGNVLVAGQSWGIGTQWDYATIKYSNHGDSLWVRRYNGPAQDVPTDIAFALAVDDSGNVYVTGWSDGANEAPQCLTIKYSPEGETRWEKRYPSGGSIGYAGYAIEVDSSGNIYVAARSNGYDDTLLKYDRYGNLLWTGVHPVNHVFATNPPRLVLDRSSNIYMSSVDISGGTSNYLVLKYNPQGGQVWQAIYHALPGPHEATDLWVDENENVYVTGASITCGQIYDYVTVKFSQTTNIEPHVDHFPGEYRLFQNYPNPFNSGTTIRFVLSHPGYVNLKIFSILGQEVALLAARNFPAGEHEVTWDATAFASGIYLYQLWVSTPMEQVNNFTETKKLLLMK